jgi:hypothetical protein
MGAWMNRFMVVSVLSSWYFSWNSCSGYFTTWLGLFPLQIVVTACMVRPLVDQHMFQTYQLTNDKVQMCRAGKVEPAEARTL